MAAVLNGTTRPRRCPQTRHSPAWCEDYTERAAILEYEGGMPRHEAENLAAAQLVAAFPEAAHQGPVTHFAGPQGRPLCGQTAMNRKAPARSPKTNDPARVTCRKCRKKLEAA